MTSSKINRPHRGRGTAAGGGGVNASVTPAHNAMRVRPSTMLRMVPLPFREELAPAIAPLPRREVVQRLLKMRGREIGPQRIDEHQLGRDARQARIDKLLLRAQTISEALNAGLKRRTRATRRRFRRTFRLLSPDWGATMQWSVGPRKAVGPVSISPPSPLGLQPSRLIGIVSRRPAAIFARAFVVFQPPPS